MRRRRTPRAGCSSRFTTGLNPCAASPNGYVYARTSSCSGSFLTAPNYGFTFLDDAYAAEYPFTRTAIPIEFTSGPFTMSFTLPKADQYGYPVPFPGDYVISL